MAEPKRSAPSGSRAQWVSYAEAIGVDTTGTRDEIMARVDAAEVAASTGAAAEQPPTEDAAATATAAADAGTEQPAAEDAATAEPTTDYTRRAGGYLLTDRGWVLEHVTESAEDGADGNGD